MMIKTDCKLCAWYNEDMQTCACPKVVIEDENFCYYYERKEER